MQKSTIPYSAAVANCSPKRHYRFHDYDYSRGAVLFITFALERRVPIFGKVVGDKVEYSAAGAAVIETIERERSRKGNIVLRRYVVMPDHVHLRLFVRPDAKEPLREVGQFVNNVKRWSKYHASKVGTEVAWSASFYDRLCVSREIIDRVDKYIDNNPLKWSLMHGNRALMRVREPMNEPIFPFDEWWSGVGEMGLLGGQLAAMKLSRRIPAAEIHAVVGRCVEAAKAGYVPISTFISPAERALADALCREGLPMIRVVPDELATVYKPKGDEPRLFAAGQLLLLSRVAPLGKSRYEAWHEINDAIAEMARVSGGFAWYVTGQKAL